MYGKYCYGGHSVCEKCQECPISGYCKDAAKAMKIPSMYSSAGEHDEWIPAPEPEEIEENPESLRYTYEQMLRIAWFFLGLAPQEFLLLKFRLTRPELTIVEIAKLLRLDNTKPIYEFFDAICGDLPEMRSILYYTRAAIKKDR